MKKDIRSFAKDKNKKEFGDENLKERIEELSNKSEDELKKQLIDAVNTAKQNGEINDESFSRFAQSVSPMLSEEQRKKLEQIINYVK